VLPPKCTAAGRAHRSGPAKNRERRRARDSGDCNGVRARLRQRDVWGPSRSIDLYQGMPSFRVTGIKGSAGRRSTNGFDLLTLRGESRSGTAEKTARAFANQSDDAAAGGSTRARPSGYEPSMLRSLTALLVIGVVLLAQASPVLATPTPEVALPVAGVPVCNGRFNGDLKPSPDELAEVLRSTQHG
jgi:hypothetical protein